MTLSPEDAGYNFQERTDSSKMEYAGFTGRLRQLLIAGGHRLIDAILGVDPSRVLNPHPAEKPVEHPAERLKQAANAMRAEAIDRHSGEVHYRHLAKSGSYRQFRELTESLHFCTLEDLGDRSGQIAFWINLYNALILDAVIAFEISGSILSDPGFFRRAAYQVGEGRFSADDIEHGVLRGNRSHPYLPIPPFSPLDPRRSMSITSVEPRIHFALVCGARSCPPIAFYDHDRLEQQLDQAAANFLIGEGAAFNPEENVLHLSRIFKWYRVDFGGEPGVVRLVSEVLGKAEILESWQQGRLVLRYMPYDWSVNAVAAG